MMRRSVGIAAFTASALQASAFLIPADVTNPSDSLSIAQLHAKHELVTLPCSDCVFSPAKDPQEVVEEEEPSFWIQGGANSVAVNFTISEDGQRLEVNGETIYPMQMENIFSGKRPYVMQVPASASVQEIEKGDVKSTQVEVTAHGISTSETVVDEQDGTLVQITYSISSLNQQFVSLDDIMVQLLKTAEGKLSILHTSTEAPPPPRPEDSFWPPSMIEGEVEDQPVPPFGDFEDLPPPHFEDGMRHHHPHPPHFKGEKECQMLPASLCKLRNMLEAKVMGMSKGLRKGGCQGRKGKHGRPHMGQLPGHIKPHFLRPGSDEEERPHGHHHHGPKPHGQHHHGRPHGQKHHGHHGHHRHHFMHAFSKGLAAVLIPTMAGVAVGMTVSLIGLLVGRLIGFLWIKLYRGGRRGYASVALDENDASDVDAEKFLVVESEDAPPVYEEAPAYEEATKEEK